MAKIILCRGIQGSGKTTYAKAWAEEAPEYRVRFNNDDIRNMLGKYWVPNREDIVTSIKQKFLDVAMNLGYDIIIDNMNLNTKEVAYYEDVIADFNESQINNRKVKVYYQLEFKDFPTSLEECIERDSKRPNPIGEEVIRNTYAKYKSIIDSMNEKL